MERPYQFGTDHARFRQVANLLRREASVTGCIGRGVDAIPHRLTTSLVPTAEPTYICIGRGEDAIPHKLVLLYNV